MKPKEIVLLTATAAALVGGSFIVVDQFGHSPGVHPVVVRTAADSADSVKKAQEAYALKMADSMDALAAREAPVVHKARRKTFWQRLWPF